MELGSYFLFLQEQIKDIIIVNIFNIYVMLLLLSLIYTRTRVGAGARAHTHTHKMYVIIVHTIYYACVGVAWVTSTGPAARQFA